MNLAVIAFSSFVIALSARGAWSALYDNRQRIRKKGGINRTLIILGHASLKSDHHFDPFGLSPFLNTETTRQVISLMEAVC